MRLTTAVQRSLASLLSVGLALTLASGAMAQTDRGPATSVVPNIPFGGPSGVYSNWEYGFGAGPGSKTASANGKGYTLTAGAGWLGAPDASDRAWGYSPAVGLEAASGFGQYGGMFTFGGSMQDQTRAHNLVDGTVGVAAGFGNPLKIAGEIGLSILSVGVHEPFAKRGAINAKLHHYMGNDTSVAVGVRGGYVWGGSDAPSQLYAVASRLVSARGSNGESRKCVYLNAGLAYAYTTSQNGIYRAAADDAVRRYGRVQVIGGIAYRATRSFSTFLEWSGEDLNLGCSIIPFSKCPVIITPAVSDLTGRSTRSPRLVLALSMPLGK